MDIRNLSEADLANEGADIVERSTLRMLFSKSDATFFAYFIVKMQVIKEKHPEHSMGMSMNVAGGTFSLSYDEERMKLHNIYDIDSVCWVEGHECMHWVLSHHFREREYWGQDDELIMKWHIGFNIAADLEIHENYKVEGNLVGKVCQVGVGPFKDYPKGGTMEEYFELWRKDNPNPPQMSQSGKGQGDGEGQEGEGEGDADGKPNGQGNGGKAAGTKPGRYTTTVNGTDVTITDNKTGEVFKFKINDAGAPQHGVQEDLDKEVLRQALGEALKEARPSMGTEPGGLVSIVERMIQPPRIDWRHRFRQMVGKYVRFSWQGSWRRFSRRMGEGFRGRIKDHGLRLCIAVDTSGSVQDYELAEFANEIENIRRVHKVKSVMVIECDARVQKVYDLQQGQPFPCKFEGRGGTDFRPVFEYVTAAKSKFDMMIWLTDSQGQWPDIKPQYPVIWAVTKESALAQIPWGDIVFMEVDEPRTKPK